jgi:flagellar biosynthesis/type III secretory pathway protein FliH
LDIAEKKKEAFQDGLAEGLSQGAQQKAVEDARKLLADKKYTAEEISELLQIPIESFSETM